MRAKRAMEQNERNAREKEHKEAELRVLHYLFKRKNLYFTIFKEKINDELLVARR